MMKYKALQTFALRNNRLFMREQIGDILTLVVVMESHRNIVMETMGFAPRFRYFGSGGARFMNYIDMLKRVDPHLNVRLCNGPADARICEMTLFSLMAEPTVKELNLFGELLTGSFLADLKRDIGLLEGQFGLRFEKRYGQIFDSGTLVPHDVHSNHLYGLLCAMQVTAEILCKHENLKLPFNEYFVGNYLCRKL